MRISVRCVGVSMARRAGAGGHGPLALTLHPGATLLDVLSGAGLPLDRPFVVSVNGDMVPGGEWSATPMADGDSVTVLPPMRGG